MNILLNILGIDTQQSYFYDFWSGVATQMSVVAAGIVYYRKHNCHVHGCFRIGKHQVGHYVVCARHHPQVPARVTHDHIVEVHKDSEKEVT